ncbi:MAG: NAD(P)H-dependent oxidoreductase [Pseudomonadota bacterium]
MPRILVFAGSTRSGSFTTRLAGSAARELSLLDCEVTRISLEDYELPIYNGDLEAKDGIPDNALKLAKLMHSHDGFFIVSPEYNGSLPPLLKNTIDWVSRVSSVEDEEVSPYRGKVCAIAAASPGGMGGMSVLYHLREILVRLGTLVVSEQVALGNAGDAFDDLDKVTNERSEKLLVATCKSLTTKATTMR